jgi:hypothetical protein
MTIEQLIALLAQMNGNFNPSLMASAMPANNVSPANIASAMSPNVLFASGLIDPDTVDAGIASTYQQLLADWESRNNADLPAEASDLYLSPVTSKYSGRTDELGIFINEALANIKSGFITAEKVKAGILDGTIGAPSGASEALVDLGPQLDDFEKRVERQNDAKLKFEITQAQKGVTSAPAPTLEQARSKYYKDLGVPEMALLPDVSAKYQFDPSMFADESRTKGLEGIIGRTKNQTARVDARDAYAQQQADIYSGKANQSLAQTAGDKARQAYLDANAKPDQITQVLDWFSRNGQGILGDAFGKDKTTERKMLADAAGKQAMLRELTRLNEMPKVSIETPYNATSRLNAAARAGMANDAAYNQQVADLVSQKLAAAGRTPNQDVMNQLLGYAATVNKKK